VIPYGKHFLDDDDINAVVEVLRNGWLTQGPKVLEFENAVAEYVGAKYAIAVSSGTAALHICCMAADLGDSSTVYTSANTFVASANCALYVGATPVFCDIDENSLNMSAEALDDKAKSIGSMGAVIPVHFAGAPCDMPAIQSIAKKYSATVIEDASHALGSTYPSGERVGSCAYSDMTVFSLHPVKGVTAGEGGVITTNNKELYQKLYMARSHGICKGNFDFPGISQSGEALCNEQEGIEDGQLNPWYYEMQELGYNYRITDLQCALATSQLRKLPRFIQRRKEIATIYDSHFRDKSYIELTQARLRDVSSHHLYVLRIKFDELGRSRRQVMNQLFDDGIGTQVHYIPVPMHPYYQARGYDMSDYPAAEQYYRESLTIPIYYSLTNELIENVIESLERCLGR